MNAKRLMNAIKKAGLEAAQSPDRSDLYFVTGRGKYHGKFYVSGEKADCVQTCHENDQPDSQTDYFPQRFHDTIKGFVAALERTEA